jgi:hypothetical protein
VLHGQELHSTPAHHMVREEEAHVEEKAHVEHVAPEEHEAREESPEEQDGSSS